MPSPLDTLARSVAVVVLVGGVAALVCGGAARFLRGRTDRTTALTWIRRGLLVALPAVYALTLLGLAGVGWLDLTDRLTDGLPLVGGGPVGGALDLALGFGGPLPAVVLAYLGALPSIRRIQDIDVSTLRVAATLLRYLFGLVGLLAGVVVVLGASTAGGPLGLLVVAAVVLAGLLGASPLLIRLLSSTREPSPAAADRVARAADRAGLDVADYRVLRTRGSEQAGALLRGWGRLRTLFVTDYLLDVASADTLDAVCALQAGLDRARYLETKIAVVAGTVVLPALVAVGVLAVPGVPGLPVALVLFGVGLAAAWRARRLVFRADDYAAERVGAETVATVIEWSAAENDVPMERGVVSSLVTMRPSRSARVARLRSDGGSGLD